MLNSIFGLRIVCSKMQSAPARLKLARVSLVAQSTVCYIHTKNTEKINKKAKKEFFFLPFH